MKLQKSVVLIAALMVILPLAHADAAPSGYVNGGVGQEGYKMMRRIASRFPLHIAFSEGKDGAYLAAIPVTITDRLGKPSFVLPEAGPLLYVRLPKGTYTVKATYMGVTQSGKVTLDGERTRNVILHWHCILQE